MKLSRSRLVLAVAVLSAVAAAAACTSSSGANPSKSSGAASKGGTPKQGGTLTIAYTNEVASMDPTANTSAAGAGSLPYYAIYDALMTLDPKNGSAQPKIAQSMTADSSQKVWTLKLRPNVKFTDGTPYDAAAVAYNWERDKGKTSAVASAASEIASTKVVNPTTLQATLVAPDSGFDRTVAQQLLFIASPTAIKSEGKNFGSKPVGAGAFKLTSWVRDSQKTFTRNPGYYEAPKPYLDGLVIKTIPDESQASTALKTGQANMMYTQDSSIINDLKSAGMQVSDAPTPGSPNLAFNLKKPPFNDPGIRKAVVEAIDTNQIAKVTGTVQPTSTPFPAGSPYNFGMSWPKYNQADAQKLFDSYAAAHGGTVNFTIEAFQDSSNTKEGQFFQTALNQYKHVKTQLKVAAASTAIGNVFTGNFQSHTWGAPWYSPAGLYIYLHTGQQLNVYGYSNPAVDKALDAARSTSDQAAQNKDYNTVVQHMVADLPFFNYGVRQAAVVYTNKVHDVTLFYDAYPFLENIWIG